MQGWTDRHLPLKSIEVIMVILQKNMTDKSEEIRIRHRYRNLILQGKARISLEAAQRLVGPDCAFHLYKVANLKKQRRK